MPPELHDKTLRVHKDKLEINLIYPLSHTASRARDQRKGNVHNVHTTGLLLPMDPKEIHLQLKSSGLYTKLAKSCLLAKTHDLDAAVMG